MPNAHTTAKITNLDPTIKTFDLHFGPIAAPANATFTVALLTTHSFSISQISMKLTSGTITGQVLINNVPVVITGGGSTLAVTSTVNIKAAISSNAVGIGSTGIITLTLSAGAAPVNFSLSLGCIRT